MIHEIINPSDTYTIECDDMEVLTASIFILRQGTYTTESNATDFRVPITIFGGENAVEFFKSEFDKDFEEYFKNNKTKIADCLDTVCIGSISDREMYFSAISKIDDESKKEQFKSEWYDKNQTSLNQIGQSAYSISEALRAQDGN